MWSALTFLGLAITDAMNPFTVAAMAILLALDRPVARGVIFAGVTFLVYLGFAILLAEGFRTAITLWFPAFPDWVTGLSLGLLSVTCLGFAVHIWMDRNAADVSVRLASALTLPGTAAFAVASTLSDAPTALPLFAALVELPLLSTTRPGQYLWLAAYCAIYVAPLLVMLALLVLCASRMEAALSRVLSGVNWSFRHLLPPMLVVAGAAAGWMSLEELRRPY